MNTNNPLTLVVFGATGDLYENKLSIALFNLFVDGLLPKDFSIIGFARRSLTDLEFQNFTKDAILKKSNNHPKDKLPDFLNHVKYMQGDLENPESFKNLSKLLGGYDESRGICTDKLFYLSVPPPLYGIIFKNISGAGLTVPCAPGVPDENIAWTRVLVEKPFGKDIEDAKRLDKMLGELFEESQIFRIDHYLAKETLQNILSFRFEEGALENFWNNENIGKVRIIFHEKNTVETRGAVYDGLGALRDVGQNHMLQMLALVAMENSNKTDDIHNARANVLEKTSLLVAPLVRGQYEGYLEERNVKPNSETETFFRVGLGVNNKRWEGVPFELEFGKALDRSQVFIEVCFKNSKLNHIFSISSNKSVLHDAYEKVFYDCLLGDQTIFTNTKEIMAEWEIVTKIIESWQAIPLVIYKKGTRAEEILQNSS